VGLMTDPSADERQYWLLPMEMFAIAKLTTS
jgi:hypothetical protein